MPNKDFIRASELYENYIAEHGISEQVINGYTSLVSSAFGENDIPFALKISQRVKALIERFCIEKCDKKNIKISGMWDWEKMMFRANLQNQEETLIRYYEILRLEAQNKIVDSYFQYVEKKRQPRERFYMPKRKHFIRFGITGAYQGLLDDKYDIVIISMPPGTSKTTGLKFLGSGYVGWFPRDYNLFYSHSGDITRMFYDGSLDIVSNSDEYTWGEIFPDLRVTDTNAKMGRFNVGKHKDFYSLQTASIGSENAGKVRASKLLLVDDMIGKLEEALNKAIKDKHWQAYTVDARQRKTMDSTDKPCKEIIQATRWAPDDVPGRLIEMYQGNQRVKVISVPDIDEQTGKSNFDYEFGGFTVEFFNDQALLMDDISYKCLYKQQPIEREGLLYTEDEIKRYSELPKGEPDEITGQCDHKGSGTDFMFMFAAYKYGDLYYIEDVVCNRNPDYETQYQDLTNLIVRNKMQNAFFEQNAGGDRVSLEVDKRVQEQGHICNIKAIPTETNKEARIYQYANWIKQHCRFRDKSQYAPKSDYAEMMKQLFIYSVGGRNANDDVVDGLAIFARNKTKNMNRRQTVIMSSPI